MYTSFVLLLLLPWYINNRIIFLRKKGKNSHSNICKAFSLITIKCLHNIYLITVILLIAQVYKKKKQTIQRIHLLFNYLNYYYFYFDFLFLEFSYGDLSSGNFTRPMNAACFYNVSETEQFCKQQQAYKQYKISRTRY